MKKIYLLSFPLIFATLSFAQNWQYVGAPHFNQTVSSATYLYSPDLEFNSTGELFAGYYDYTGVLYFAKYSGGNWSQLPSPGTYPGSPGTTVQAVDIEVQGSDYYFSFSRAIKINSTTVVYYSYVTKFNGSSWALVGDSLLLNSGSFDFLLDNNGVPTVLGVVTNQFSDKKMMQYSGNTWNTAYTFVSSAATQFKEGSGIFNSLNKLYCITQGYVTSPSFKYFTLANQIDAGVRTAVGDTVWENASAPKIKLDANGVPYLCFQQPVLSKVMAYKLNGASWSFIADTTGGNLGTLLAADVTGDGKVVFNTLASNLYRSVYFYQNNTRYAIDSVNTSGGLASISDLVIPAGSNDAHILAIEIKTGVIQDLSVLKHAVTGAIGIDEINSSGASMTVYPNPSNGSFTLADESFKGNTVVKIFDVSGKLVYNKTFDGSTDIIVNGLESHAVYFAELVNEKGISKRCKLIVQ